MKTRERDPLVVSCGIFRKELVHLGPAVLGHGRPVFLDSMLHMHPARLDDLLLQRVRNADRRVVLVYGDCCPHMGDLAARPRVVKVRGVNCCDILLGQDAYRQLRREGVFFFLPEWTGRWEEVFREQLGLEAPALAREFMQEMHRRLMYLDTGLDAVPRETLKDIEAFFGLPMEIRSLGLEQLGGGLREALRRLDPHA